MTDAAPSAPSHDAAARRTLVTGGALLVASAVAAITTPSLVMSNVGATIVIGWLGTAAFSAALALFAIGLGPSASIVARRPLGVAALLLIAAWPFLERILTAIVPYSAETVEFYRVWGYASAAVWVGAAIVAAVEIARAGAVAGRVRWLPLWALVAVVAPQVLAQIIVVALGLDLGRSENDALSLLIGLGLLASVAAPIVLGVVAIVQAYRPADAAADRPSVQVYPPAG